MNFSSIHNVYFGLISQAAVLCVLYALVDDVG
jgi:hypothetical protein